jgi:hypothetical protein
MQQNRDQVDIGAVFPIESVVAAESRQTWGSVWIGSAQAAVELCAYVVCIRARGAGNEISIRQLEKKRRQDLPVLT